MTDQPQEPKSNSQRGKDQSLHEMLGLVDSRDVRQAQLAEIAEATKANVLENMTEEEQASLGERVESFIDEICGHEDAFGWNKAHFIDGKDGDLLESSVQVQLQNRVEEALDSIRLGVEAEMELGTKQAASYASSVNEMIAKQIEGISKSSGLKLGRPSNSVRPPKKLVDVQVVTTQPGPGNSTISTIEQRKVPVDADGNAILNEKTAGKGGFSGRVGGNNNELLRTGWGIASAGVAAMCFTGMVHSFKQVKGQDQQGQTQIRWGQGAMGCLNGLLGALFTHQAYTCLLDNAGRIR